MKKSIFLTGLLLVASSYIFAQNEEQDLYDLSLEELMNIEIVSASKKKETVFDAPMSSYTITGTEIKNAGSNSIAEALRLCPELIVREVTNGVYDVHIRGFDNMPRLTDGAFQTNQLTLVMIDDRPVFNHNMGAVYWEALPIEVHDVERIEIVKGPSAPLFGPNAVSGVINIITKKGADEGVFSTADVQYGTQNSLIGRANVGLKQGKFSANVSGNFQQRDNYDDEYFEYASGRYVAGFENLNDPQGNTIRPDLFGDADQSIKKWGVNLFTQLEVKPEFLVGLDAGTQQSENQRYYFNNGYTPISYTTFNSNYLNLYSDYKGLKARASLSNGRDNLNPFVSQVSFEYEYNVADIFIDYTWNVTDNLTIQPGLNYQRAKYTGLYDDEELPLIEGTQTLETSALSLRFDYKPIEKLRLIAALRGDKFSQPDDTYLSYQFASTYHINEKNMLRAVYAKSNSSAFIGPTYLNVNIEYDVPGLPGYRGIYQYQGNPDMKLFNLSLYEFGYRVKLLNNLEADLTLFHQEGNNFYSVITNAAPPGYLNLASTVLKIDNLKDMKGVQNGVTLSLNWVPVANLQVKPFGTYQHSEVENLPSALRTPDYDPNLNTENVFDDVHEPTPAFFGGAYINYQWNKFNINLNPYYMSSYIVFNENDVVNGTRVGHIDNTLILNAKISYKVLDHLNIYINGRNLTGTGKNQHYGTSKIDTFVSGGINFTL